jgi:hypothetical protein
MDQTSYQKKALECLMAASRMRDLGARLKLRNPPVRAVLRT